MIRPIITQLYEYGDACGHDYAHITNSHGDVLLIIMEPDHRHLPSWSNEQEQNLTQIAKLMARQVKNAKWLTLDPERDQVSEYNLDSMIL